MSDSLRPHGLQHSRPPYPSPGVYWSSCPLSWWCHPTVSSSVIPFSSRLQSLQASGSFLMSQFFTSGAQSIGVSASASVLPMNIQDWFPSGLTGLISLQSTGLSRVFSNTTASIKSINSSVLSFLYSPTLKSIHDYWKNVPTFPMILLNTFQVTSSQSHSQWFKYLCNLIKTSVDP